MNFFQDKSKILHSIKKILHDYFYPVGVLVLQQISRTLVNLNYFSVNFLTDFYSLLSKVKEDITQ